jgi:hypothetical protein
MPGDMTTLQLPVWLGPVAFGACLTVITALLSRAVKNVDDRLDKIESNLSRESDERRRRDHELAADIQRDRVSIARLSAHMGNKEHL